MKLKLLTFIVMFLLASSLAFATIGNVKLEGNFSTLPSDYLALDYFNRSDNTNLGSLATGQSWSETGIFAEIIDERLVQKRSGASHSEVHFTPINSSLLPDGYTISWLVGRTTGIQIFIGMSLHTNAGCTGNDAQVSMQDTPNNWKFNINGGASGNVGGGGGLDASLLTDTWFEMESYIDTVGRGINFTIRNVSIDGADVTRTDLVSTSNTSFPKADVINCWRLWVDQNDVFANTTELAMWAGKPEDRPVSVIIDVTPPSLTISSPDNNTALSQNFINFTTTVTDDLSDNIICHLRNETDLLDEDAVSSGAVFNLTYLSGKTTIQQKNLYNITCFDNDAVNNNSFTEFMNITLDNVIPAIAITLPLNNSIFDKTFSNISTDVLCTDPNAIALNLSLIDSNGIVLNSFQNNTAGSEMRIRNTIDISTVPTGNYNLNATCVDGHTYYDSKVKSYYKVDNRIFYNTESGNDLSIDLFYSSIPLCDLGSRSASDREIFWYDFKSCNPDAKGIQTYKYILRDNDDEIKYLPKSEYKTHFVTNDNFITFQIDETASYSVRKISARNWEVILYTSETFLDFRNSIGGLNKFQEFLNLTIIESNFTSIEHFDIEIDDIILDSDTFVIVSDTTFNLSQARKLTMLNSLVLTKFSLPQSSDVTGRITFNNEVLLERSVSAVAGLDTMRSINFIINRIIGKAGENNLTYEVKEDGAGAINISDWQTQVITNITASGSEYGTLSRIIETTFSSSSLINISSIPVNKALDSRTFIDISNRLEADVASTVTCLVDSNVTSPIYRRRILSATDVASTGVSFIDDVETGSKTFHLNCSNTEGATISSNATFLALNLRDLSNNIISANSSTNANTGITGSTVSFSAGNNELATIKGFPVRNGTELLVTSTVHLNSSTGDQTVRITLNSSNGCLDQHERSLTSADIGTIKFYSSCIAVGVSEIDITLGVTVSAGETVEIVDETLSAIEVTLLNKSVQNIAPIVVILSPLPNEILFSNSRIEWFTTELNKNNFLTNVTAVNVSDASDITSIALNLTDNISNITFNFSTLGEGTFNLNIVSFENETGERLTGSATLQFSVLLPTISVNLTSPLNNSVDIDGLITFNFVTDTGNSNNCSLFIDNTINFINQSINATVGTNIFNPVRLDNGTHTWLVRCNNGTDIGVSTQFIVNVAIPDPNALSIIECPTTIAGVAVLGLIIMISLVFITLGFIFQIGVVGFFGAILLMVSTWFISPCSNIFAYILALLSAVLMFFFIFRGFFPQFSGLTGRP